MSESKYDAELLDSLFNTTVKNVGTMPDEGEAEYEVSRIQEFEPGQWDGDDVFMVLSVNLTNCDNAAANVARVKIKVYADKDPVSNVWVRDENGVVITRGLEKVGPNSNYGKLLAACWPNPKDREGKTLRDMIGERIRCFVSYEKSPNGTEYAKVNPRPL